MKLVYMTPDGEPSVLEPATIDSHAEYIYVYACETEDEWWHYGDMDSKELCEAFDFYSDGMVPPGAMFRRFSAEMTGNFIIFRMSVAYNV